MNKVSSGTRLASMFIDHAANTFIMILFALPVMIPIFANAMNISHEQEDFNMFDGPSGYLLLIPFCIYFLKDSISGRSIAKRVMKIQVVDNITNEAAGPIKCFIRNIFCVIWPIEGIVTLFNPQRRIGDFVAGTKVVPFDNTVLHENKVNYLQIFIAFILAYSILLAFFIPCSKMMNRITESSKVLVVESSYDEKLSKEIEKMYDDSLGNILKADVRAYDKIKNDTLKYVSLIFRLKENSLELESSSKELFDRVESLLYKKCPKESYTGQAKYVYMDGSSMQMTSHKIGK